MSKDEMDELRDKLDLAQLSEQQSRKYAMELQDKLRAIRRQWRKTEPEIRKLMQLMEGLGDGR